MRCVVYARVSTTRQAEQNISIPDQISRARKYAEARGFEIVGEYVERGASARDDRRPKFQAMVEAASQKQKPFDIILVHSFSRFFRDEVHFELYRRRLEKRGVSVISITQETGDGPGGELTRRVIALMDEMRSKEDAKHVKRGMEENARQGFWNGAMAPLGYKIVAAEKRGDKVKKKLAIDPQSAETVKLIFKLFVEGDGKAGPLGVKNIASWLNARGYKTPRGGAYYTSRVYAILTNETYAGNAWFNRKNTATGEIRPREQWIKTTVPVIIPGATFRRVQMLLKDKRPSKTPPRLVSSKVLLSGLAICEGCGKPLMMTTGKGGAYRYYKCSGKHLKGRCKGELSVSIREEKLDELILRALTERLLTPRRTHSIVAAVAKRREGGRGEADHTLYRLRGQLAQANKRVRNLLNALADGVAGETDLFKEMLSRAEEERAELTGLVAAQEVQVKDALKPITMEEARSASVKLKQLINAAPADLKKRYIRALVSEIVVGKSEIVISGPKDALAEAVTGAPPAHIAAASGPVRSLVREWRT
ncbi:recombinase family protein [Hyphococcus formosus]|uniref:recombinase family protein n=1 Tax=Hyphococcus formosus TaxID=3143534 RepID=UPI00398A653D